MRRTVNFDRSTRNKNTDEIEIFNNRILRTKKINKQTENEKMITTLS